MRTLFPHTRAGRSVFHVRRYVVLALCAALLVFSLAPSSAQRRTAIRVPAGELAQPAPAPREDEREREKEKKQRSAARRKAAAQKGVALGKPVSSTSEASGVRLVGSVGIKRTTEDIMMFQSYAPEVERTPRLLPEHEMPERDGLPQNPNAKPVASTPSATLARGVSGPKATKVITSTPQTLSAVQFDGATLTDTGAFPPDSMGAVGPTQFIVFVNGRIRSFTKAGAADGVLNADPDVFFAPVMTPVSGSVVLNFTSDPQVRYDRLSGRWFMTIIDVPCTNATCTTTAANRVLMAVSDAASNGTISAGTVWTLFEYQADPGTNFCDYPSLGVDSQALYTGCNIFSSAGSFVGTNGYVVQKSSALGAGPLVVTMFANLAAGAGAGPESPRGVDNYDPTSNEGYFIGPDNATFSTIMLRRVSNPGSATPTISGNISITVPTTTTPNRVPHLGNTGGTAGQLDSIDDRFFAAHIRNGRLWSAQNFRVNTSGVASTAAQNRNAVRWYEFNGIRSTDNGGTPVVIQSGTIFDNAATAAAARQYWMPSVAITGQGHAVVGFTMAGTPSGATPAFTGRLRTDTLGTMGGPPTLPATTFGTSTANYNPPSDPGGAGGRRWGDYSFCTVDPLDDMTVWTIQEYNQALNSYAVRVAKINAPPPATPTTASPATVATGQASVNVTITGTSVSGSEFYDPGTDLAPPALPFNHITASVSGGITVNSVTYTDPTHVTLNLNTTGATTGPHDVTITNPDGQSTTGLAVIVVPATAGQLLISEFRLRGPNPNGAQNEFIEIYNNSGANLTVTDSGAGAGYGVAASDGVLRCTIPNGTIIPNRGHFLCANSVGYSLSGYAAADATYATDIPDNAGIALFNTTVAAGFTLVNRLDAVGSTSEANPIYKEGTGYPALTPFSIDYAFVRDTCGKGGSITTLGPCPTGGLPKDTDNNAADFYFVDTNGTSAGAGQRLGAPGPENLASPIQRNSQFAGPNLDSTVGVNMPPNRVRDFTSDPANNSTFGTLDIRKRIINNTGASVTRLRFRIVDLTTFPAPSGFADLRPRTSTLVVVSGINDAATCLASNGVATTPCTVNVQGTTLEQPPSQLNGGGFNSTLSAGTVTLGTPLANGASINVRFLLGIQQTGTFKFFVNVEALP